MGHPSTHGDDYQLNIGAILRQSARTYHDREIVYRTADGGWDRYTYADLERRVAQAANVFTDLGVRPGDVVGVLDWNSKRHLEMYFALPGMGAVELEMNLRLGPADMAFVVRHAEATVICVDETLLPLAESLAPTMPDVHTWVLFTDKAPGEVESSLDLVHFEERMAGAAESFDWPLLDEKSACYSCFSTGTTGNPKGVFYSHRGVYLHTVTEAQFLSRTCTDTVMPITPMFHVSSWGLPQAAVFCGAKIVLPGRYSAEDTPALVDIMVAEDVSVINGAPVILQPMLDHLRGMDTPPDWSNGRFICGASEPPLTLMRGFSDLTGAMIVHAYGATETTPLVAINLGGVPSVRESSTQDELWDLRRSQGFLPVGVDIRIVDELGAEVPAGESGEILLRGPWVIESYWNQPDGAERFLDGWWRSGDAGRLDEHGYLKLTDRLKDVIKSGGEWISSIDMENKLLEHPNIKEAAVIGVPHPKWQERPVAVVVSRDGTDLTPADLHGVLEGAFAGWQMPDQVVNLDALPRTSVGKLDKKRLRGSHSGIYQG